MIICGHVDIPVFKATENNIYKQQVGKLYKPTGGFQNFMPYSTKERDVTALKG